MLIGMTLAHADGLLSPIFPVFDGAIDRYSMPGWQRSLDVYGDKHYSNAIYITFATDGYDLEKVESGLLHLYAQKVRRSGRLSIFKLLRPIRPSSGRCVRSHDVAIDSDHPLAEVNVKTKDEGEQLVIRLGNPFRDDTVFYGLCLIGDKGLIASFGSMETDHPPVLMARFALPTLDSIDFADKLSRIEAAGAKADSAAQWAYASSVGAAQDSKDAFTAMGIAREAADSARAFAGFAAISADSAKTARRGAEAALSEAQSASASATASATEASQSSAASATSATEAAQSSASATASATEASQSAAASATSATEAAQSSASATASATEASQSAAASATSATESATSATSASQSSLSSASASFAAGQSATLAANSATSAGQSAALATTKLEEMKALVLQGGIPAGFSLFSNSPQTVGGFVYTGVSLTLESAWQVRESLPTTRANGAAVWDGRYVHFLGGNAKSHQKNHYVYDTLRGHWSERGGLPSPRTHHVAEFVGGGIIVSGGLVNNGTNPSKNTQFYDARRDTWSNVSAAPSARHFAASAVVNNILFVIGGAATNPLGTLEAYNPANDRWTTLATMPTARQQACAAAVDELIYVFGGVNKTQTVASVEVYNPANNTWSILGNMPTAMRSMSAVVVDGRVHILGGQTNKAVSSHLLYDPDTDTWTSLQPLPSPRFNASAVAFNRTIMLIGGTDGPNFLATVQDYAPASALYLMRKQ